MFGFQMTVAIGLLLILYGIHRALMHSEIPSARMIGNASGAVMALLACVMAVFLQRTALNTDIITSDSMMPTLISGDRLFSEKTTYRRSIPKRGDIITFMYPSRTQGLGDDIMIKRVIGVPGDTVEVRNGAVYVNETLLAESYVSEAPEYSMRPLKVGKDKLFVLGDNRNESDDGHVWGLLDKKRVVARATFRFWPLGRMGILR